jgi:hypothetical protein
VPDRLQTFRNRVNDASLAWQSNVLDKYSIAYNTAFKKYLETFEKQKENDKATAELFVSMAAIIPGSILMATAATSSLRVLANRGALFALSQRRAAATLSVYNAVASNATAKFAVGKVLDVVKDEAGKKIKDAVVQAMSNSQGLLDVDPFNRDKQLHSWLVNHQLASTDAAEAIEADRSMNDAAKEQAYVRLRAAPIANRPSGRLDPNKLAPRIELGFYMVWLLESDTLETEIIPSGPYGGGRYTSKPIQVMPSDPRYPKSNTDRSRGPVQWVAVKRPGSTVEDRIDVLNRQLRGHAFYEPGGWFGKREDGGRKLKEVAAAERVLLALSHATQPLAPLGLAG